jgi:DNA modification methylase
VPCVVLDCFAGTGTSGLVAERLGRDSILIELSSAYAEMASARIYGDAPMFARVEVG